MSTFRSLTLQSGQLKQQQDADTLIVGAGITTNSGNLSLSTASTDVQIASGKNLSLGGSGGNVDFSASNGTFKTTTGTVTLGAGAVNVTGNMTMQAGTLLSTSTTGNINLPNNGNAKFQIETVAVSANVTAANLGTLTAGASSIADSLHTHAGLGIVSTLTTTGVTTGLFGYISSNSTLSKTDNLAIASSRAFGCNTGTAGSMQVTGQVTGSFTTVGGSPTAGAQVYLAASTDEASAAGKLTATVPASGVVAAVGICTDNSGYSGAKTALVLIQIHDPVQL